MKSPLAGMLLLTALLLAACPRDRAAEVRPDTLGVAPPHDPAAVPQAARSVPLQPAPGQALTAEAIVIPVGVQTQMTLHLRGAAPNAAFTGHLVTGTCDRPGPIAADLQPVNAGAAGVGTSQIVVDVPPETVLNGNHVIELRSADGERPAVACGEVPALAAPAAPAEAG